MARRHVKRANPPRWTREGRLLRKQLSRGSSQPASAPEAKVEPVVDQAPVQKVEAAVVEVQEEPVVSHKKVSGPAKKPARRRRRRSKTAASES